MLSVTKSCCLVEQGLIVQIEDRENVQTDDNGRAFLTGSKYQLMRDYKLRGYAIEVTKLMNDIQAADFQYQLGSHHDNFMKVSQECDRSRIPKVPLEAVQIIKRSLALVAKWGSNYFL